MTYSPWAEVARMTDITVAFVALPDDEMAWWDPSARTIEISDRLDRVERRATLAHEIEHVLAGDGVCHGTADDGWFTCVMERRASIRAARKLIPIEGLAEAIALYNDHDELMAEHLDVDLDTLDVRRDSLQPQERRYLRERLAAREETA